MVFTRPPHGHCRCRLTRRQAKEQNLRASKHFLVDIIWRKDEEGTHSVRCRMAKTRSHAHLQQTTTTSDLFAPNTTPALINRMFTHLLRACFYSTNSIQAAQNKVPQHRWIWWPVGRQRLHQSIRCEVFAIRSRSWWAQQFQNGVLKRY